MSDFPLSIVILLFSTANRNQLFCTWGYVLYTLVCLISVYPLLNVYRGILTIESERVHLEMLPNKRVQWIFPLLPNTYNHHAYNIHVHNNPYVHNEHSYNIHVHNNPIVHNQDQHFLSELPLEL